MGKKGAGTGGKKKIFRILKKILRILFLLILLAVLSVVGINAFVMGSQKKYILPVSAFSGIPEADCILVLGCGVHPDKTPTPMLADRLERALEVYRAGASPKFLMSGDHGTLYYNEVGVMKKYVTERSVASEDVFMDHAGFSTYESIYRAKEVFGAERIIIVTQEYHLYRALYIANALGMEAYGVSADYRQYAEQSVREAREAAARIKDFAWCFYKPEPTYLGDPIDIHGNGDVTND